MHLYTLYSTCPSNHSLLSCVLEQTKHTRFSTRSRLTDSLKGTSSKSSSSSSSSRNSRSSRSDNNNNINSSNNERKRKSAFCQAVSPPLGVLHNAIILLLFTLCRCTRRNTLLFGLFILHFIDSSRYQPIVMTQSCVNLTPGFRITITSDSTCLNCNSSVESACVTFTFDGFHLI